MISHLTPPTPPEKSRRLQLFRERQRHRLEAQVDAALRESTPDHNDATGDILTQSGAPKDD
jgi:hypothetical protein